MICDRAIRFDCAGAPLIGILHLPQQPATRAVLVVTGGPQYRIGSHRQFVLLGRHLADNGIVTMRFDYRGMGDSGGEQRAFCQIDDDLQAAVDCLLSQVPAIQEVVLWGLCDGATAAALYAARHPRLTGLVMLNPWVQTEQGLARSTVRHYYAKRLADATFWRKLLSHDLEWGTVTRSFTKTVAAAVHPSTEPLPFQLYTALAAFQGRIFVILSGDDLTAHEFASLQTRYPHWRALMAQPRVRQAALPQANHTFASARWRDEVAAMCTEWLGSW